MGRKLKVALIIFLAAMLTPMEAFAGEINGAEAGLLGLAGGVYEKDGYYWSLKPEYGAKGAEYCMRDDVDISYEEAQSLANDFYAAIGDPQYFNKVGEVENPSQPTPETPKPETPAEPAPEAPEAPAEDVEAPKEETGDKGKNDTKKDTEEAKNDVSDNDVSDNDISANEAYSDGLTDNKFEAPKTVMIDGKEVSVIKISEEIAKVGEPNGLDEFWEPARDYSNEKPIQKLPNIGVIVLCVVAVAAIVIAAILITHNNKSHVRYKR